jgi:hypothetical protein
VFGVCIDCGLRQQLLVIGSVRSKGGTVAQDPGLQHMTMTPRCEKILENPGKPWKIHQKIMENRSEV